MKTRNNNKKQKNMKAVINILVQSAKTDNGELKNILGTFALRHQAEKRFSDILVELVNKKDEQGNFLWECESSFGYVARFKRMHDNLSMLIELVEREIEI
jgi:hypothetical protein